MLVLKLLLLAYAFSLVIMFLVTRAAISDKAYRVVFLALGAVLPVIIVYAFVKSLLAPRPTVRFNAEFGAVEDAIEAKRVKIFGGEPMNPSLSERWQSSYRCQLQKMAEKAASLAKRIEKFTAHLHAGRA